MRRPALARSLLLLLLAACDGDEAIPDGIEPAPDGTGYCCPRAEWPDCDCSDAGGWVPDWRDCAELGGPCDVAPGDWHSATDVHGCRIWDTTMMYCCNCDDAGAGEADAMSVEPDSSVDPATPEDASSDATTVAGDGAIDGPAAADGD